MITERCGEKGLGSRMQESERDEVIVVGWVRGEDRDAAGARRRERTNDKHRGKPTNKHASGVRPNAAADESQQR
jgi:hypothetical protein